MAIDEEDISALIDHGFKMKELVEDLEAEIIKLKAELDALDKPPQPQSLSRESGEAMGCVPTMSEIASYYISENKRLTGALHAAKRLVAELTERGRPCQPKALAESIGGHWHGFECAADVHPWEREMYSQGIVVRLITPHSWTWHPRSIGPSSEPLDFVWKCTVCGWTGQENEAVPRGGYRSCPQCLKLGCDCLVEKVDRADLPAK